MDVKKAIQQRRSIRSYLNKDIDDSLLLTILQAAQQAPSASNRQEWRFIIVKDPQTRKLLCQAAKNQRFVMDAPVVIACCAVTDNHTMTCGQLCYPIDLAIAIDHMTLQAVEIGLGTCWIGAFREDEVKKILNVPDEVRVVELLTLGYPSDTSNSTKERLAIEKITFKEKWAVCIDETFFKK